MAAIIGRALFKAKAGAGRPVKRLVGEGSGDNTGQNLVLDLDNLILQRQLAFFSC
jgi:hypothetical protein